MSNIQSAAVDQIGQVMQPTISSTGNDGDRHIYRLSCIHILQRLQRQKRQIVWEAGLDPIERNESEVAKRPRDMKNRGFLEPKNWTTPR